jgi:hypothetical protein
MVFGLRMDSPPPVSVPNRTKGIRIWFIIAAACLIAVIVAIISSNKAAPEPNFVWLDQSKFASQMRPGRLKRLYYKVVNFTAPVWQHFRRPKTHILIGSKIMAVHGLSTGELGIGAAIATNESGAQVWILSPFELDDLRQRLKTSNGIDVVNAPSIATADGEPATLFVGYAQPQTFASIGVTLDVSPKIASHQFQLAMNAVYTQENDNSTAPIRTNLSAACRVRLPNAGGVLISSPVSKELIGTNYWLILSATAIDGFGKPIKL